MLNFAYLQIISGRPQEQVKLHCIFTIVYKDN